MFLFGSRLAKCLATLHRNSKAIISNSCQIHLPRAEGFVRPRPGITLSFISLLCTSCSADLLLSQFSTIVPPWGRLIFVYEGRLLRRSHSAYRLDFQAKRRRGRTPTPGRYLGVRNRRGESQHGVTKIFSVCIMSRVLIVFSVFADRGRSISGSPYYRRRYSSSERERSYSPSPYRGRRRSRSRSPARRRYRRSYSRDERSSSYSRSLSRSPSECYSRRRSLSRSVTPRRSYSPRPRRKYGKRRSPSRSFSPRRRYRRGYSRESYSHSRSSMSHSSDSRSRSVSRSP